MYVKLFVCLFYNHQTLYRFFAMQSDGELMADDVIKTTFYLDREVHKSLRNLAIQQNRSMNQQAQYLLRRALMPQDDRVSRVLAATKQAVNE